MPLDLTFCRAGNRFQHKLQPDMEYWLRLSPNVPAVGSHSVVVGRGINALFSVNVVVTDPTDWEDKHHDDNAEKGCEKWCHNKCRLLSDLRKQVGYRDSLNPQLI